MRKGLGGLVGRVAQVLGLNAVPVAGYFGEGWSQGTALATYWVESLLVILFVSTRIALHRKWTRKAGHFRVATFTQQTREGRQQPGAVGSGSLLSSYLGIAIPFTLVHGLFLGLLLFFFLPQRFGTDAGVAVVDLGKGALGVLALLAVGFAIDLVSLRERSFRWLEIGTQNALGRIFVVHMTILFGMGAVAFFGAPGALFAVFAGLKTLFDLGGVLPHRELERQPPRALRFLDRFRGADGESFSAYWRRTEEREQAIREENERVVDDA